VFGEWYTCICTYIYIHTNIYIYISHVSSSQDKQGFENLRQVYKHKWQDCAGVLKGEKFHSWFAVPDSGEAIQLPLWINTALEVLISQWLATREAWDKRIAARALDGKLLAPSSKKRYEACI